jgi:hypothetical protein
VRAFIQVSYETRVARMGPFAEGDRGGAPSVKLQDKQLPGAGEELLSRRNLGKFPDFRRAVQAPRGVRDDRLL